MVPLQTTGQRHPSQYRETNNYIYIIYKTGILHHSRESQRNKKHDTVIHSCGPILSTTEEKNTVHTPVWGHQQLLLAPLRRKIRRTHLYGDINNYYFTSDKKEFLMITV
jgi:hypothetical protein